MALKVKSGRPRAIAFNRPPMRDVVTLNPPQQRPHAQHSYSLMTNPGFVGADANSSVTACASVMSSSVPCFSKHSTRMVDPTRTEARHQSAVRPGVALPHFQATKKERVIERLFRAAMK
jgi:hypothetical protein